MYSKVDFSELSSIGNILLKVLSIPLDSSFNCSLSALEDRNSWYEFSELQLNLV